ncbi:aminoglycoside phosphotransferase family protein [Nucisporomicrobium flavum]|uniref:aminoglycoside phosphotransferase family protein n=1 Tax=Nucisporomicrobium flavum TaxID=2785915 RepID=UPI003C2BC94F
MSTTDANGRYTEAAMTEAMRYVADRLHVPSDDALLLRLTNNAVFALPTAAIVVRITRSSVLHDRVYKVARLAIWFAERGAPTIRLAAHVEQPVPVNDLLATVWEYVPPTEPAPTVEDLGHLLSCIHHLGTPPFSLPTWDPVADARSRLADAEALRDEEADYLLSWCDRLAPRIAALNKRSKGNLVHGDAHVGNLLRTPVGDVVIGDFDATCKGPWQVDLVAVPVGEARFGRRGTHAQLARAYGYDVTQDPDWATFREARELKMVCAAVPLLASAPGVAREFRTRLHSVRTGDQQARWTPFADLRGDEELR